MSERQDEYGITVSLVERLVIEACEARGRAYAPYSEFAVGAALLTDQDDVIRGCNVENASFAATICAERNAAAAALCRGHRHWRALAIAAAPAVPPCGICRQFLSEFAPELPIYLIDAADPQQPPSTTTLQRLLPQAFDASFRKGSPG